MATPGNYKIALIIDGEVVDLVVADARHAAILLSSPKIVDVTNQPETPYPGWKYDEAKGLFERPTSDGSDR